MSQWIQEKANSIAASLVTRGVHPSIALVLVGSAEAPGPIVQTLETLIETLVPKLLTCITAATPAAAAAPTPADVVTALQTVAHPIRGMGMRLQLSQEIHRAIRDQEVTNVAAPAIRAEIVAQCKAATEADGVAILAA